MADTVDVAARLAEGRPAVAAVEQYVAACRRLGYQHPDLTAHPAQVRDWYSGEDGLDLRAVESDHGALSAAASAAEDAARMQADVAADLDAAWSGRGATAAREFLWRSCQSATAVSAALRAAADELARLRDALWQAVDAEVAATETVDGGHRAQWLAAATTVTTGVGDVAAASELVGLEITPFVDSEIAARWVAAMREATSAVDAAYDAAIARITAPVAVFGVPGVLGPRGDGVATEETRPAWQPEPAVHRESPAPPAPAQTVPAAAVGSNTTPAAAAPWSAPESATTPPPLAPAAPPPMSSAPTAGDLGAGTSPMGAMGSTGSGLGGFGQQLADLIGGLIATGGQSGLDEPGDLGDLDDDLESSKDEPDDDETDKPEGDEKGEEDDELAVAEEAEPPAPPEPEEDVAAAAAEPPPAEPAPTPPPEPAAPPEPPPAAVAQPLAGDTQPTPCEIAADELPQVGE
ncbi:hypothetical protein CIW49_11815 [Mycolicibacterium sp. P1-18]|uniref:hypothetical protein n=1 Tax=Mycolicibacterium sp. P1-18 TaxID=2024615 RepID=UPI0011F1E105|nr:hypothetical protein [Mycolicibacterium sp. P1-18]KAA0099016.1 hypothetical protein CIW49_11815 [Mycolicibacterium sp. P1-18]